MNLLRKKLQPKDAYNALPPEHKASIEIVAHKNAQKQEVEKVKLANKHLADVLEKNHFTLRIYLALGGKTKLMKKRSKND